MKLRMLLAFLPLMACTPQEPEKVPVPYAVPTYVPCKPNVKLDDKGNIVRPVWADTDDALQGKLPDGTMIIIGIDGQISLIFKGRQERDDYIAIVETALNGCMH